MQIASATIMMHKCMGKWGRGDVGEGGWNLLASIEPCLSGVRQHFGSPSCCECMCVCMKCVCVCVCVCVSVSCLWRDGATCLCMSGLLHALILLATCCTSACASDQLLFQLRGLGCPLEVAMAINFGILSSRFPSSEEARL